MSDALSREEDAETPDEIEEIIAEYQKQRGPQPNISYFAFTATPRNVTLERFGIPAPLCRGGDFFRFFFQRYCCITALPVGGCFVSRRNGST